MSTYTHTSIHTKHLSRTRLSIESIISSQSIGMRLGYTNIYGIDWYGSLSGYQITLLSVSRTTSFEQW